MKHLNFSLLAVALVLCSSPCVDAQLLRPIDPSKKADVGNKLVKFGDAQLNTVAQPTLDLPNAELSKGNLKLQNTDTKSVADLESLEFSTVETHVVPQTNFTGKRIATKTNEASGKNLDDRQKRAPITNRLIRAFTPAGEQELKKQLNEPH
ncbi:MAG TPA: hypothetical protein VL486_09400 [Verrucomicrobiae bacterium]|nr:hypothetical protein [Verrucomicrobiae bacterium]